MENDLVVAGLRKWLRMQMNEAADFMVGGGCKSWDEYQNMTGRVTGLALTERKLLDLCERDEDVGSDGEDAGE